MFSDALYNRICLRASILSLKKNFLSSAIQTLAYAKLQGNDVKSIETRRNILFDYCRVLALIIKETQRYGEKELPKEEIQVISQNRNVAEMLAYISMDDTVKRHHVKAMNEGLDYVTLLEKRFSAVPLLETILLFCEQEIDSAVSEMRNMLNP